MYSNVIFCLIFIITLAFNLYIYIYIHIPSYISKNLGYIINALFGQIEKIGVQYTFMS